MRPNGQALIIVTVFLAVVLSLSVGTAEYFLRNRQIGKKLTSQVAAQNLAEAGIHKALWCLNQITGTNCGGTYGLNYAGESNVNLDVGSFTITLTSFGAGNERAIVSTGVAADGTRRKISMIAVAIPVGTNFELNFGTQAAEGGIVMANNSSVIGATYSNGDISCGNGSSVTGDAAIGGPTGKIEGCTVGGSAQAHTLKNSDVAGDAYYQDKQNTSVGGTSYPNSPDPPIQPLPLTDEHVANMKNDAAAGGIWTGDFNPGTSVPVILGPKHITGNLVLDNGETLTLTGTIWVDGHVTIGNGSRIVLSSIYGPNSGTVLADGYIELSNNGDFAGSGNPNSFLMIMSEATGGAIHGAAINISNNAVGALFYARNGDIYLQENVQGQQVTGKRLVMENNATVIFNNNIITTSFTAGTGGIWRTKKGTWSIIP